MVESRSIVKGASPGPAPACPCPCQQLAAHPVQLADVAPPEAAQEGAQCGWHLDQAVENTGRPTGSQRIGVVDAISAGQRRGHQRHYLVAGVGPARRITQIQALLYQLGKTEVQGQGGWEEQAGIVHQAVIVEGDFDAVEGDCVVASIGCSFSGTGLLLQNHYPRFRGAPSCRFRMLTRRPPSVDSGLVGRGSVKLFMFLSPAASQCRNREPRCVARLPSHISKMVVSTRARWWA